MKLIIDGKEICDCTLSANAIVTENFMNNLSDYENGHDVVIKDGNTQKYHWENAVLLYNYQIKGNCYILFREQSKEEIDKKIDDFLKDNQTNIIDMFPEWKSGVSYETGKRIGYNGIIYKVLQAHTAQSDWMPDKTPALFSRIDGRSNDADYPDWVQPTGATDTYAKDDKVTYSGKRWVSDLNDNVWVPGVYGWSIADEKGTTGNTESVIANWVQPTGATDAYAKNAKVTYNGKTWVSTIDNNVWAPGVYGWTETEV